MSESERAIRVIPFSGKNKDWNMWSKKFLARAKRCGYRDVLNGVKIEDTKKKEKMNDDAYADLILAMSCEVAFGYVDEAVTKEFPEGDAAVAWENLKKKFQPSTTGSRVQYKNEFNNNILSSVNDDPDEWIAQLEKLRKLIKATGSEISDEDLLIHVINNLPKEYEALVDNFEKELDEGKLTIEDMRLRLSTKFQRMEKYGKRNNQKGDGEATALTAVVNKPKKECRFCGKKNHLEKNCWFNPKNMNKNKNDSKNKKFTGECYICGKTGHKAIDCPDRKINNIQCENVADVAVTEADVALMVRVNSSDIELPSIKKNIWVGDSGASQHMRNSLDGMFNLKPSNRSVKIGDGKYVQIKMSGSWRGEVVQKDGRKLKVTLEDVDYSPNVCSNLFSITHALRQKWNLGNEGPAITIEKNGKKIIFDHIIGNNKRYVCGVEINTIPESSSFAAMDINDLHRKLGHACERSTQEYAKENKIELKGKFEKCVDCGLAKARQKNVPKLAANKVTRRCERLYLDISGIKHKSLGGSKFWVLLVDEFTRYKWSVFLKNKSDLATKILPLLKEINKLDSINYLRCDNAGENKILEKHCMADKDLNMKFEYTAPNTPQQNGVCESGFRTLWNMVRASNNAAGFDEEMRNLLWAECANTVTKVHNLLDSKYEKFYGKSPNYKSKLQIFGHVAVIANRIKIQEKLKNKGKICIFVGYAENHAGDVYRFLNTETRKIIESRDAIWMNKSYGEFYQDKAKSLVPVENFSDYDLILPEECSTEETFESDEDFLPNTLNDKENEEENSNASEEDSIHGRDYYTKTPSIFETLNDSFNDVMFFAQDMDGTDIPETFDEAWNHPDVEERKGWRKFSVKEIKDMLNRKVWKVVKLKNVPKNRRLIGVKWVFVKKRDGRFRPRIVAKGFMEIPGVDYSESFAPVVKDETFRLVVIVYLIYSSGDQDDIELWVAVIWDITTAFLYGDLDEEIYMRLPDGLEKFEKVNKNEDCLVLNKAIYGLIQAARQFYKKLKKVLVKDLKFENCKSDPCLFFNKTNLGICIICCYVDDLAFFGNKKAINDTVYNLKKQFEMKYVGDLREYVGCRIDFENGKGGKVAYLTQPDIVKKIENKFGSEILKLTKCYGTPSSPGYVAVRPKEEEPKLTEEVQKRFRSGVGTLLYLVKHSRPDISNSVREHAKVMDSANKYHYKELLRTMKYVVDTRNKALKFAPFSVKNNMWQLRGICDSAYAPDPDTR